MSPQEQLHTMIKQTTPEQRRRFFLAILSDETHGVLLHVTAGSEQELAISEVIYLLKSNCKDRGIWEVACAVAAYTSAEIRAACDAAGAVAVEAWAVNAAEWAARACAEAGKIGELGSAETTAWVAAQAFLWAALKAVAEDDHYQWMAHTLTQLMKEDT